MQKIYTLFIIIFSFASLSLAQTGTLKGTITDAKSKQPLMGVNVIMEDKSGTASDFNGNYELKLKPGTYNVLFRFIGYGDQSKQVTIVENGTQTIDIIMDESQSTLPMMVVSAGKFEQKISDVTVSMQVIKADLVENKNTTSMETVIDQIPGVSVVDNQPSIRGGAGWSYGAGSRVLIMVNDLPMLAADAGDVKWSFLPVENVDQIEVIEGASSALFGSSALNGVINIRTAFPKDTPQTRINVFDGIYDSPGNPQMKWWGPIQPIYAGTNFLHSQKFGQFDLVVGGDIFNDDGYRQGEVEQRYRFDFNTRYRFKNIPGLSVGLNFNTQYSTGGNFLLWQNDSTGALKPYGGIDTVGSSLSNYITKRTYVDPYVTYFDNYGNVHKIKARWFDMVNINDTQQGSVADMYYGEYQFQRQMKKINAIFTAGVSINEQKVTSVLYGNHNGINDAVYAQFDKKFKRLSVSIGVRSESYKIDTAHTFSNEAYKIGHKTDSIPVFFRSGINYQLFKATWLRASYGQGFRYPTIAEKYISSNVGAIYVYPDDSLKPESGWSAEIGLKQGIKISNWLGYFDIAGFWTRYKDMMEFTFGQYGKIIDPAHEYGLGFESLNIGDATISGVDVSIVGQGNIGPVLTKVLAGFTYMNPVDDNTDSLYNERKSPPFSNFLKYRFEYLAKADIEFSYKKASLGFSYRYNSFMKSVDSAFVDAVLGSAFGSVEDWRNKHQTGDFFVDARCSYMVSNTSKIAFIIKNMLNRVAMIRPGDVAPPRSFVLQYTLDF